MLLGFSFAASAFPSAGGILRGNKAKPSDLTWPKQCPGWRCWADLTWGGGSPALAMSPFPREQGHQPGAISARLEPLLPQNVRAVQTAVTSGRFSLYLLGEKAMRTL